MYCPIMEPELHPKMVHGLRWANTNSRDGVSNCREWVGCDRVNCLICTCWPAKSSTQEESDDETLTFEQATC